ncbi:MAG: LCP family protein [Anaerolineales bacterium]|nr:LCP family protein [Anaerolineales bacterium]
MLKNKSSLILIFGLVLLALVVLVPIFGGKLIYSATPKTKVAVLNVPSGSTPTATAFQPLTATETYLPTDYPTSTPTITPHPEKIKPVSNTRGVDPIIQPDGQINIVLLGSDQKYKGYIGRTDTIILVTINTKENTVNVTSFPRDLYIFIPGWTDQRINTAFAHGGFPSLKKTFLHNFGFEPDYYILINLWTFEYIINDLGGIYVDVPQTLCDDNWNHGLTHCVYQGRQLLYGKEALWYARSRMTTNDFNRNVRQQLVLGAIFDRFLSLDILSKIPNLYNTYINNLTTDLDLGTVISLAPTAAKLSDKSLIKQYFINQDVVSSWVTPGGAHVQLPNYNAIRRILKNALNSP